MYRALDHAGRCVKPGGQLFIAIYNDQGGISRRWLAIKKMYCSGLPGRWLVTFFGSAYFALVCLKEDLVRLRNPFTRYREYKKNRGMSMFTDWIDWFGGYPFEVAKPEVLFAFYQERGFDLEKLITVGGNLACNELVLRKTKD
jgi:2-polyprenyl-6-hydroxyphenyl methylase/3-demethylubiquinone-9 3-methyltransferase